MDSGVSDDQKLLMETSARFVEEVCPLSRVREKACVATENAAGYRRRAADLGWFSLLVPDELGGGSVSGNGVLDAALIAYERGRLLQPGPFVPTNVVAYALATAGTQEQQVKVLPTLLSGEQTAAWVAPDLVRPWGHQPVLTARRRGSGYELSGRATLVQDADTASWMLVAADAGDDIVQMLVDPAAAGVSVTALESLDITRTFAEVAFDRAEVPGASVVGTATDRNLIATELAIACVLTTAESVGAMDHDFGMAVRYAKDRIAFGRPIGSFQAVKHLLADTSLMLEMSKAATLAAANSLGTNDGYGVEAASIAKAFVGDCGIDLAQNCFQVFGGIGFTWEHDQHLYLRRITTDATLFGDPAWHREHLCRLAGL